MEKEEVQFKQVLDSVNFLLYTFLAREECLIEGVLWYRGIPHNIKVTACFEGNRWHLGITSLWCTRVNKPDQTCTELASDELEQRVLTELNWTVNSPEGKAILEKAERFYWINQKKKLFDRLIKLQEQQDSLNAFIKQVERDLDDATVILEKLLAG